MKPRNADKWHARRVRAWHQMSPVLRPLAQEVRCWWIEGMASSYTARWDVGARVNAVRADPGRFGRGGAGQLARFFRDSAGRLAEDALVARAFDRETVERLARREMRGGGHLAWGHMVLLAGVPAGPARSGLIEAVFEQAMTAKALANEIEAAGKAAGHASPGK